MRLIRKLFFIVQCWWFELLLSLMPSWLFAYVLNGAIEDKMIERERDSIKERLVWIKIDNQDV